MFELGKKAQAWATQDRAAARPERRIEPADTSAPATESAVIGRSIRIDGDVRGDEDLRIDGDVTGTIELPNSTLTVGSHGRIKADIYAKSVVVDGKMDGDLYGSECVSLHKNGRVVGNIIATRVSVEEGARFKGSIDMDPESVEAALAKHGMSSPVAVKGRSAASKEAAAKPSRPKPVAVQSVSTEKSSA